MNKVEINETIDPVGENAYIMIATKLACEEGISWYRKAGPLWVGFRKPQENRVLFRGHHYFFCIFVDTFKDINKFIKDSPGRYVIIKYKDKYAIWKKYE